MIEERPMGVLPGETGTLLNRPAIRRGFAAMDPQRQREIASEGGRAAHLKGTAHEFTPEEAALAGAKGGRARAANQAARVRVSQQMSPSARL